MTFDEALKSIEETIKKDDIVVFMKGTPDFPMCGFSGRVVQIFSHLGHKVTGVNVLEDENMRAAIKQFSNWPTIPQIYIKGEFIGGCDITVEMAQSGELQKLLADLHSKSNTQLA
jgi:monothiol glutaredoxin